MRRRLAWIAAALTGAAAILALAAVLVVQSAWFSSLLRRKLVAVIETATGARVEIGSFTLDWTRLRVDAGNLVIHGSEPQDKPPLFRAQKLTVGLKIVSILEQRVDVASVDLTGPQVYLIIGPDGRTNIPEPKTKKPAKPAAETILDLAIGRFNLRDGMFDVESRGSTPIEAAGRNLSVVFDYQRAGLSGAARYHGTVGIQPLTVTVDDYAPTPADVAVTLAVERNRVVVESAEVRTGESQLRFSGTVEDLSAPRGSFRYDAHASQADVARFLHTKLLDSGSAQTSGTAAFTAAGGLTAKGSLHAWDIAYTDAYVKLRGFRADGAVAAGPNGIDVSGLRLSGFYTPPGNRIPVDGTIAKAAIDNEAIRINGLALATLGGEFHGQGVIQRLDRFHFTGDITGFQARRVVAVYSPEPLPWDGRASGPVEIEGRFRGEGALNVSANLAVGPEAGSPPVSGQISATYNATTGILDLGRSSLALPSSRAEFSGAIGQNMRVHLETRDLNDLLPALGASAASFPVSLRNGGAVFDGAVQGQIEDPHVTGHLSATRFEYAGTSFDSLSADVTASQENVRFDNGAVVRGAARAQFQGAVALRQWQACPDCDIFGNANVNGAPLNELASLLNWQGAAVSGALTASVQATGTVSKPILRSEIDLAKGAFREEPFDRFTGRVSYSGNTLELSSGQVAAGAKQASLSASYQHAPGSLETGHLRFQVSTNVMPLAEIATLAAARPGVSGTAQATVTGGLDIRPAAKGARGFEITELQADVAAHALELSGQPLGDARLTAVSEGRTVRAQLESDFAGSTVRGSGSWRLEDDYPGSASIDFSKLDLVRLRVWLASGSTANGAAPFVGSAEGSLRIDGPILRIGALKAELRIAKFELGPAPGTLPPGSGAPLMLHNASPIVAVMANNAITIESARLQGRSTDVTIAGRAMLDQKSALDLRVNGRVDLGILQDYYTGLTSAGTVIINATARGSLASPQIGGRLEVQNASLRLLDFPNGLSQANGVILFSGDRATIQSLSGESGGGTVELTGFAGYGGEQTPLRMHVNAHEVRVRYPEGVSTVANASLSLTGTPDRSTLSGTVTVLRTGFNPQSDFSSVLAASAEPVRTPSAPTGPLGGMNFDIQIQTAPDIQVQSSLTQDVGVEANLRLKGTVSNPGLVGRINVTQGQLLFFGTKYNINQGSIAFYNQAKIEPIVNVDLETKARGIDVTLTVSGPLGKMNLTPRSDPPLQFNEIVALLATGQAPTSDPSLLAQGNTSPQSWQQMGASALLGQAIASPVAGRLQRFFGVSRLRIDPTLPGVQYNPQARLTVEEQITPAITFTYITVVNSSNPQVVSVEWSLGKQWSVNAVREENGVFGLDFFVKRQFK